MKKILALMFMSLIVGGFSSSARADSEEVYGSGGVVSILFGLYEVTCPNESSQVCVRKETTPNTGTSGEYKFTLVTSSGQEIYFGDGVTSISNGWRFNYISGPH